MPVTASDFIIRNGRFPAGSAWSCRSQASEMLLAKVRPHVARTQCIQGNMK